MITTHEQQLSNGFAIGWLTLALPRTLNALTLDMARTALLQLEQWVERRDIACVVLRGEGRAFVRVAMCDRCAKAFWTVTTIASVFSNRNTVSTTPYTATLSPS
ncbi:MAG: enoyl-CoA hydratase/isomerase family protein [Cellvibrionales bacterium]|nr:enoyl-CoA hydratase/isomerase family protein [Cellvibrionales bacterium]